MSSSLATGRDRRSNAGNRMTQVLDGTDDEFYKSTYGGFDEVSFN